MKRFLRDLLEASIIAAMLGLPFAIYLWNMTPA